MLNLLVLLVAFQTICFSSCESTGDLGPGIWSLVSIGSCPEGEVEEEKVELEVKKHKLNRTHDGISAHINAKIEINDNLAMYADICKYVDGGCKRYHVMSDDSVVNFFKKYAGDNLEAVFNLAKLDPPTFPIPEGEHSVEDFMMDYCQLPRKATYGKYKCFAYLLEDTKKVSCVQLIAQFDEFEDENYCD